MARTQQRGRAQAQTRNVPPVAPRNLIDSGDLARDIQDGDVLMPSTGDARLVQPVVQVPDGPATRAKAEELAFMNELVTVMVHESDSKFAEPFIPVWNYGRIQIFPRGVEVTCKRKFVEVLARTKGATYGNHEYVDPEGNRAYKYPKKVVRRFSFTVTRDDNPRGRDWLKKTLAEA
jgi:hypothetical protein